MKICYFQNLPYLKLIFLLKELNLLSAEVVAFVLSSTVCHSFSERLSNWFVEIIIKQIPTKQIIKQRGYLSKYLDTPKFHLVPKHSICVNLIWILELDVTGFSPPQCFLHTILCISTPTSRSHSSRK